MNEEGEDHRRVRPATGRQDRHRQAAAPPPPPELPPLRSAPLGAAYYAKTRSHLGPQGCLSIGLGIVAFGLLVAIVMLGLAFSTGFDDDTGSDPDAGAEAPE